MGVSLLAAHIPRKVVMPYLDQVLGTRARVRVRVRVRVRGKVRVEGRGGDAVPRPGTRGEGEVRGSYK